MYTFAETSSNFIFGLLILMYCHTRLKSTLDVCRQVYIWKAISMYRKLHEWECIAWCMGTSDVFQVLKIAPAAGECNLRTFKTSWVTIYYKIHEWSYNFLFIIVSIKLFKKSRKHSCHASMDTQLCNGFQTAQTHVLFQHVLFQVF